MGHTCIAAFACKTELNKLPDPNGAVPHPNAVVPPMGSPVWWLALDSPLRELTRFLSLDDVSPSVKL